MLMINYLTTIMGR